MSRGRFGRLTCYKGFFMDKKLEWFQNARFGLLIQYGLYSLLGRGEWVMNREGIPPEEYAKLADRFTAENFNADELIRKAKSWGMHYAVFYAKHHEGFCLYDSTHTDFNTVKTAAKRDLLAEFVAACRQHGLKVGIAHTLNDWSAKPDAVDALENPAKHYQPFIDSVHAQIREVMTNYGKIDILWYDGWWPFDGQGWQAEKMNKMVRALQPDILINGRCGLKGDFQTPERQIQSFREPWEACFPISAVWSWHPGDDNWLRPKAIAEMLRKCSAGHGNLLLNVGPRGDGSIPEEFTSRLDKVGAWLERNGEAIFNTERFEWYLRDAADGRAEWNPSGGFTASGNCFYWHLHSWPGAEMPMGGVRSEVLEVTDLSTGKKHPFTQMGDRITVTGFPAKVDLEMPRVIRFRTRGKPLLRLCGGMRLPKVPHCHYDPLPSEMLDGGQ